MNTGLRFQTNCDNVAWTKIPEMLKQVGMGYTDAEIHKTSFEKSYSVCFVYDDEKLIGFGRSISDGVRHSAIYDVCVDPDYQGKKIGTSIMKNIMSKTPNCTFILYAAIGKEKFYKKLGFKVMKTGMGLFSDAAKMNDQNWFIL